MSNLRKVADLKSRISEMRRDRDKAQGALDRVMKEILEDYGCRSVKDAKAMLKELTAEEQEASASVDKALKKFEKRWGDILQ